MKPDRPSVLFGASLCVALLSNGCVEPSPGSNIQIEFREGTHVPGDRDPDDRDDDGRPPAGAHYMMVAVRGGVQPVPDGGDGDGDGDGDGEPAAFAFEVAEFDVAPIINPDDPCFIEGEERSPFPGLHSTQVENKWREELGLPRAPGQDSGAEFDPDTPMEDAVRVLTARRRVSSQRLISNTLRAVIAHTPFPGPTAGALCATDAGYDPADLPPPTCLDDESNAARLALCRQLFAEHPNYYVGSDEVLSFPINGQFLGAVEGTDPRNDQPYGGAQLFVSANLQDIDALLINFQYDCSLADFQDPAIGPEQCEPQYPAGLPAEQRSTIGFHYMSGTPQIGVQRGVTRISLRNRVFQSLRAEAAIFFDLDDDGVNF